MTAESEPEFSRGEERGRPTLLSILSANPRRALVTVFLLSFVGVASTSLVVGLPVPSVHDELSYLLAADTYARGRAANPAHPQWRHFESPHVIQQPTYASKYQPAQGAILAIGQRISGHAVLGVWLGVALMGVAVTWMLQSWLPPRWALLGGILTALEFGFAGVWAHSYWGGGVVAAGAALLFGAGGRLSRGFTWPSATALGAGCLIMALSRPFEGLVVFLIVVASLIVPLNRMRSRRFHLVAASIVVTAVLGAAFQAGFNRTVTGDASTMPYALHSRQYDAAPLFLFQSAPSRPEYEDDRLRRFHVDWELSWYEDQRSLAGWLNGGFYRVAAAGTEYLFGPPLDGKNSVWIPGVLLLPFLLLPHLLRRARSRYAFMVVGAVGLSLSVVTYFVPHYLAVLTGVWMYLVIESVRLCRAMARRTPLRRAIVPLVIAHSMLLVVVATAEQRSWRSDPGQWHLQKAGLERDLSELGGRHVVLVRYDPDYDLNSEWVYNTAAIDEQDVVWARSLGARRDDRLVQYYGDRTAWWLDLAPEAPARLEAYAGGVPP